MRGVWWAGWGLGLVLLSMQLARGLPDAVVLRLTDMTPPPQSQLRPAPAAGDTSETSASAWLWQRGWEQVWPLLGGGKTITLAFAGPPAQRYLKLSADKAYTIWSHRLTVDPQQLPILEITWAVERFPEGAALDLQGRNDRAIVAIVSLGPKVPSSGLLPDVPRGLAFFWGETETVGATYTCIPPRQGPPGERLQ